MEILQAIALALVQGITEFLPISSSAHLILVPLFTGWPDQGLAFDVALNTATLLAVILYCRRDLIDMGSGLKRAASGNTLRGNHDAALAFMVVIATIPVAVAGFLGRDMVSEELRTFVVIGASSILWGIVLFFADRRPGEKTLIDVTWPIAMAIGLAQAIAIVPGTSRAGITITVGLFLGLNRVTAARFSFLLFIVVGALAGAHEALGMLKDPDNTPWGAVAVGFPVAFITAYLTIHYFLKFISHAPMTPFVVYRVLLGVLLVFLAFG